MCVRKGIWRVQIRTLIDPDAKPLDQFTTKPSTKSRNRGAEKRKRTGQCLRTCGKIVPHPPAHGKKRDSYEVAQTVQETDRFRPRAARDRKPIDKSERRGDQTADNASREHPVGDICHFGVVPDEINNVKNDACRQQAEREYDQDRVYGMTQKLCSAFHLRTSFCSIQN